MMPDTETIVRRHISKVAKPFDVEPDKVDLASGLKQELGISSMKLVLLMTSLCKEFGITLSSFDERDLAGLNTGSDLIRVFEKATNGS